MSAEATAYHLSQIEARAMEITPPPATAGMINPFGVVTTLVSSAAEYFLQHPEARQFAGEILRAILAKYLPSMSGTSSIEA